MSYKPQAGSLPARVCEYFAKHADEELSSADIALKFDHVPEQVASSLAPAVDVNLLKCVRRPRAGQPAINTYSAGETLPETLTGFKAWLAKKGPDEVKGRSGAAALPDPASLLIEAGVPIPAPMTALQARFADVFSKMKVGDSFGCDLAASKPLINAATRYGKGIGRKFVARRVSGMQSRIWRSE